MYNLMMLPLKAIKGLVDGLIERFPSLGVVLKPIQIIVNKIYEAFKAIGDLIENFSFDKMLESLKGVKDSVGGFLDKLNPLNLFSSDKDESESKKGKDSDKTLIKENSKELVNNKEITKELVKEKIQPLAVEAPKIEAPAIEMPKIEIPKVEIQPLAIEAQA